MADAQLQTDEKMKSALFETDDGFRELVREHHALDEQISRLTHLPYLTEQQHFEETALKKKKLALKDRIETVMRSRLA